MVNWEINSILVKFAEVQVLKFDPGEQRRIHKHKHIHMYSNLLDNLKKIFDDIYGHFNAKVSDYSETNNPIDEYCLNELERVPKGILGDNNSFYNSCSDQLLQYNDNTIEDISPNQIEAMVQNLINTKDIQNSLSKFIFSFKNVFEKYF
jgi:hypothetical protein